MGIGSRCPFRSALTDPGDLQLSADGTTWAADFAAAGIDLIAGQPVDFYARVDPATMTPANEVTSFVFDFEMTGADGGLVMGNVAANVARITGTTPANQAGQALTVGVDVSDSHGTTMNPMPITGTWAAAE